MTPYVLKDMMDHTPRAASHLLLRRNPNDSFTARARGLLASEFALLDLDGWEFGQLRLRGPSGAEFRSGGYGITLEASRKRYRMLTDDEEMLTAIRKERNELEISCDGQTYEARASLFRNLASASHRISGERVVRLSGGLTGRSYQAILATEDGCALLVAVFLLWYLNANRRRAYLRGSPTEGGAM